MYCIYCGSQNTDDANFCSNCGKETTAKRTEEAVESSSKVQAHHPWMRAQQEPQEQVQEKTEKAQVQTQGEVENALKFIRNKISGWSKTKKILAGVAILFLFLVCVGAVAGEPVEDNSDGVVLAKSETPEATSTSKPVEDNTDSTATAKSETPEATATSEATATPDPDSKEYKGEHCKRKPESTEESWYLCRSVGEGRGKVAVRV